MEKHVTEFVLGGGCFWCTEAIFQEIVGVIRVTSGYAGGRQPHPTYEEVSRGDTGHAEVVKVAFDRSAITPDVLLDIFFVSHDPTTPNRQGNDVGSQYRSIMLYADDPQRVLFEHAEGRAEKIWQEAVITEIAPLEVFYEAESYHRNYFAQHPEQAYCQVVIAPKLRKVRQKYAQWFKTERV